MQQSIVAFTLRPDVETGRLRVDAELSCGHHVSVLVPLDDPPSTGRVFPCTACAGRPDGLMAAFRCTWPDGGGDLVIDFVKLWPGVYGEPSEAGTILLRFAAPFEDVTIENGEALDPRKADRLRGALAYFARGSSAPDSVM